MTEALQRGPSGPAPPLCVPPPPPPEAKNSKRSKKKRKEPTPEPVPTVRSSRRIAGDAAAAADRRAPPLSPQETQSEATTAASPSRAEIMASETLKRVRIPTLFQRLCAPPSAQSALFSPPLTPPQSTAVAQLQNT